MFVLGEKQILKECWLVHPLQLSISKYKYLLHLYNKSTFEMQNLNILGKSLKILNYWGFHEKGNPQLNVHVVIDRWSPLYECTLQVPFI